MGRVWGGILLRCQWQEMLFILKVAVGTLSRNADLMQRAEEQEGPLRCQLLSSLQKVSDQISIDLCVAPGNWVPALSP